MVQAISCKMVLVPLALSTFASIADKGRLECADSSGDAESLLSVGTHVSQMHLPAHAKIDMARLIEQIGNPSGKGQLYFRPVSTTLRCVMVMTVCSLFVYTSLSIARNVDELSAKFVPSMITQTLTVASRTASLMPMVSMLFVGCRMYILATTEGLGEPPSWVKMCMKVACSGLLLQIALVIALPGFVRKFGAEEAEYDMTEGKAAAAIAKTGNTSTEAASTEATTPIDVDPDPGSLAKLTGEQNDVHPILQSDTFENPNGVLKPMFWIVQAFSMMLIYGGILGVFIGIQTFPIKSTKISAAVLCTIMLSIIYFLVYFLLFAARNLPESDAQESVVHAALAMSSSARKAPMFAVLFLVSRMRALNLDPPYGMPPFWMQCCFYTITGLVYLEVACAAIVGATGKQTKGYYGVYVYRCANKVPNLIMHVAAIISCLVLIPIVHGIYSMKDSGRHEAPVSTTMNCVLVFEYVYFGVHFLQNLVLWFEDTHDEQLDVLRDTCVAAGISLGLCPMFCILFVATRMRALQITQQHGSPQGWAQDCMNVVVFATLVQSFCCLVMPIFIGSACKVDDDGNPDYDLKPMIGAYAVTVVKYVALMLLHGGVIAIFVSICIVTPETANSEHRIFNDVKALVRGLAVTACIFFVALLLSSAKVIGMAIKLTIESCDRALLGVDITIRHAALSAFKGYVHISRLVVHQPDEEMNWERDKSGLLVGTPTGRKLEWREDYIIKVRTVVIKINLWRLIKSGGTEFELENLSIVGVHANIEKPNCNMAEANTNVEYVLNYMESIGLLSPPDDPEAANQPASSEQQAAASTGSLKPTLEPAQEPPACRDEADGKGEDLVADADGGETKVVIGKIHLGDIGAGVVLREVPVVQELCFHPTIGEILFLDVQQEVFGGRDDLTPGEMVGCIVAVICRRIIYNVTIEIPKQILQATGGAAMDFVEMPTHILQATGGAAMAFVQRIAPF